MKPLSPVVRKRMARSFPPLVVQQLAEIEQGIGGRQQLVGMLALAPLTDDLRYILGLLGDPQHQSRSLAEICGLGNVLPGKLLEHLAAAALLRGKLQASQKIGDGIAAVAEDVMRRAAPYEAPCNGGCAGTGTITPEPTKDVPNPSPDPCEVCHGTGRLIYSPDLERQKLAIEMAQLLPKHAGIQIAQINGAGGSAGSGSAGMGALERLSALTDQILYGGPPADEPEPEPPADVEGEVLPQQPPADQPPEDAG